LTQAADAGFEAAWANGRVSDPLRTVSDHSDAMREQFDLNESPLPLKTVEEIVAESGGAHFDALTTLRAPDRR